MGRGITRLRLIMADGLLQSKRLKQEINVFRGRFTSMYIYTVVISYFFNSLQNVFKQ